MIPQDKEQRVKIIAYMIEGIKLQHDELGDWEREFTYSVEEQFERKGDLTVRQCEKLEQIYNRYC